ncbi:glycosyltransferase [Thiomonas sp.]|uniref:glycosyltransferase n=1 Tax=Thiomonas sp. TaxID=2047785 RepID=UPI00261DB404|nr:glycosyltransferase [Thiomonas sp.]
MSKRHQDEASYGTISARPTSATVPEVSIIIPLFNNLTATLNMLASLRATLPNELSREIILVDDGSTDQTRAWLAELDDPQFLVLLNKYNLGYAGAVNQGAQIAKGKTLVLMNNDLVLRAGWLEPMLAALERLPEVGLVGNVQIRVDTDDIDHAGIYMACSGKLEHIRVIPAPVEEFTEVFAVSGACLAIRREIFQAFNGFDTAFYNGCEDVDLCMRLRKRGLKIVVATSSRIGHYVGLSRGTSGGANERNSRMLYARWRACFLDELSLAWLQRFEAEQGEREFAEIDGIFTINGLNGIEDAARRIAETILRREEQRWARELDGINHRVELVRACLVDPLQTPSFGTALMRCTIQGPTSARNFFCCGFNATSDDELVTVTLNVNGFQRKTFIIGKGPFNLGIADPVLVTSGINTITVLFTAPRRLNLSVSHIVIDDHMLPVPNATSSNTMIPVFDNSPSKYKNLTQIIPFTVLLDMRPALDGYYGIPQETRLLFAALAGIHEFGVTGLLQMSTRRVKGGTLPGSTLTKAEKVHRHSRVVVSLKGHSATDWKEAVGDRIGAAVHKWALRWKAWGFGSPITLKQFETPPFRDFVWQQLFSRSVPPEQRECVLKCDYAVCASPWRWMHLVGIERSWFTGRARYPVLDTQGVDIFIAQTPYPGRVRAGTKLVVHYHDAIPVLMPHTISDRAFHEASHFQALAANVRDGAYFVCVSEATRRDLLSLFPEAAPRAVTIHNMIPSHYHPGKAEPERVPGIVRRHLHDEFRPRGGSGSGARADRSLYKLAKTFSNEVDKSAFYAQAFGPAARFLLMVSTIEPRKNHLRLIEAWEVLRDQIDPDLKLVLVGHIGWDHKAVLEGCLPWIEQGGLFMLHSVPADSLRILYQQATVTVCPSVGEGFDFSGAEAMRCGGVVAASDIPVHREVYGDAAVYFDPYDTASVVQALRSLLDAPDAKERAEALRQAGIAHSERYLPENIVPQWEAFLRELAAGKAKAIA